MVDPKLPVWCRWDDNAELIGIYLLEEWYDFFVPRIRWTVGLEGAIEITEMPDHLSTATEIVSSLIIEFGWRGWAIAINTIGLLILAIQNGVHVGKFKRAGLGEGGLGEGGLGGFTILD